MSNVTINSLPVAGSIDATQDYLPIYTASASATQGINRNTLLGITGSPVGTTDSQTLTNKTLTSPTINGATLSGTLSGTYTIGGTPTFPSSVATLTGTQTLTNKTLTSPTITSPNISNATFSADTVAGYTTSNTGTIYGVSITGGQINGGGVIGSSALATNAVQGSQLSTSAITLGYEQITSDFNLSSSQTTSTQVTGLSATVTIPSGGRKVKITAYTYFLKQTTATASVALSIWDGAVNSGTQLQLGTYFAPTNNYGVPATIIAVVGPSAGSKTYNVGIVSSASTNVVCSATTTSPAFILVELI